MSVSMESTSRTGFAVKPTVRDVLPLCLAAFSGLLNVGILGPFVAVIADELGVSVSLIGFTATASLVTTAVIGLAVGWIADSWGLRLALVGGLALLTVSGIGAALAFGYVAFLLARSVGAIGFAAASGLPNAIAANRYDGEARQRVLGYVSAASVLAGLAGPPLLTYLGDVFTWRVAFALVAVVAAAAALGVRFALAEFEPSPSTGTTLLEGLRAYRSLLADGTMRLLYLATALQMAGLIGTLTYAGAYLTGEIGLEIRYVGFAFAAQSLGGVVGSILGGRVPESRTRGTYLLAMGALGLSISGIYVLGIPLAMVVILLFLSGMAQVTGWVTLVGLLARATPGGQGATMVLNGSMLGLGGAAGSAVGGALLGMSGYGLTGMVLAAFAVASGLAVYMSSVRTAATAD